MMKHVGILGLHFLKLGANAKNPMKNGVFKEDYSFLLGLNRLIFMAKELLLLFRQSFIARCVMSPGVPPKQCLWLVTNLTCQR